MLLARIKGHNVFDLFKDHPDLFSQIKAMIEDEKFEGFVDIDEKPAAHPIHKKLALVLTNPEIVKSLDDKKLEVSQ